jgi:hypothetical protein
MIKSFNYGFNGVETQSFVIGYSLEDFRSFPIIRALNVKKESVNRLDQTLLFKESQLLKG